MKIREIIAEGESAEDQLSGEKSLSSNLVPVLMFLKKRSEEKELSPKLHMSSLIQLVNNSGNPSFDYRALVDAYENSESVKNLIKSFNNEEIILKSDNDSDEDSTHTDDEGNHTPDPEVTVNAMAKSALAKRQ